MRNGIWLYIFIFIGSIFFTTNCKKNEESAIIKDVDGNVYTSITIGTQVWMAENLKTTRYSDGVQITAVVDNTDWSNLTSEGYCLYNNDISDKATFGGLYNWYAVNTGKLCPAGWHVPADADWGILDNYLIANGYNYDGSLSGNKIAKSLASTVGWQSSTGTGVPGNTDYPAYRNKSGFAAVSAGFRDRDGVFKRKGFSGDTWSSTDYDSEKAMEWDLDNDFSGVFLEPYYKKAGFMVRCLKD